MMIKLPACDLQTRDIVEIGRNEYAIWMIEKIDDSCVLNLVDCIDPYAERTSTLKLETYKHTMFSVRRNG